MLSTKRLWLKRDEQMRGRWLDFLADNDLQAEPVDYTTGVFDGEQLVGTGSVFQNIIKLVAVCGDYQDQNVLTQLMTKLTDHLWESGVTHYFLYTTPENTKYFSGLGFKQIVKTEAVVFMERGTPDFNDYKQKLQAVKTETESAAAIVMNANPFTKGHLYLIETALERCEQLYVFVLSDDSSEFSFEDRLDLVKEGTAHLPDVTVIPSRDYQVSQATFPAYFLKDQAKEAIARYQAELDATLFKDKIAPLLNIQTRFVGEEPFSKVTEIYNDAMAEVFGDDVELVIVPRLKTEGEVISATRVRKAIDEEDLTLLKRFVPETTYQFLEERLNS